MSGIYGLARGTKKIILTNNFFFLALNQSMSRRILKELESAINYVKKQGLEVPLAKELIEANKVRFVDLLFYK